MTKSSVVDIIKKRSARLSAEEHHTVAAAPFIRKETSYLLSDLTKGDGAYEISFCTWFFSMVTYTELFALGMLIVAIIGLCSAKR